MNKAIAGESKGEMQVKQNIIGFTLFFQKYRLSQKQYHYS